MTQAVKGAQKDQGVTLAKGESLALMSDLKADAWVNAWASVLQKSNRIVTGIRSTVQVTGPGMAFGDGGRQNIPADVPSWTDGSNIYLNQDMVRDVIKNNDAVTATLRLKGLNYHEVCHMLYTPRADSAVHRTVTERAKTDDLWLYAYNTLEDQRIETWFTSMYGASRRYFEALVMEWILTNGTSEAAITLYGRKYLTPKIRVRVGQAFVARYGTALYEEFKTIIDSYLTVTLPGEDNKALSLIGRFHTLLKEVQNKGGALPPLLVADNGGGGKNGGQGHSHDTQRTDQPNGGGVSQAGAKQARSKAMEAIEDALDADADFEADEAANGGSGGPKDPGQIGGDTKSQPPTPGGAAGADSDGGKQRIMDLLEDAAQAQQDIAQDQDVQKDVNRTVQAVNAVVNNSEALDIAKAADPLNTQPAPQPAMLAMRRTHDVLARIRMAAEPETLFRQVHGRIDARRLTNSQPGDIEVFRTYNSGREDEVGVEAVMLVDISGSMTHLMADASMALWSIKKAMDKLDIPTTVILFDTPGTTKLAYKAREKAPSNVKVYGSGGGTEPSEALAAGAKVFYKSNAANKVLITLTDGQWGGGYGGQSASYEDLMKAYKRMNVSSLMLGLQGAVKNYGLHYHDVGYDLDSVGELPKAMSKLVANVMSRAELSVY